METVSVKKRSVEKLVGECIETVEELELDKNKHKCSSYTLHVVLFSILFTVNIGIGDYFLYFHWYLRKDVACVMFGTRTQTTI